MTTPTSDATPRDTASSASVLSSPSSTSTKETHLHSSPNHALYVSYAIILCTWIGSQLVLIPYVVHLLVLVTAILYVACHLSLVLLQDEPTEQEKANGAVSSSTETLRQEDAYQFPLLGSASLLSLYLAFKFLDKAIVNLLIGFYFCVVGCFALYATGSSLIPRWGRVLAFSRQYSHPLPKFVGLDNPLKIQGSMSVSEIMILLASILFCVFYAKYKHWAMNNLLGICFCLQGIERFSLGTFKIGAILLIGLFFYDIFWVFGTDVMVTVAKNLDGPIKILFPRGYNDETGKLELSLLGLGDIVIPGFFLALLLRFDASRAVTKTPGAFSKAYPMNLFRMSSFPKPYFHATLLAYVLGLAMTLYVMIVFQAAQPALLYLVPACLGSSLGCALVRGELKELLAYSEEEPEEGEKSKEEENKADTDKKQD